MAVDVKIDEHTDFIHGRILPPHITFQDRVLIAKLLKQSYRDGFLNGMNIRRDDECLTPKTKKTTKIKNYEKQSN